MHLRKPMLPFKHCSLKAFARRISSVKARCIASCSLFKAPYVLNPPFLQSSFDRSKSRNGHLVRTMAIALLIRAELLSSFQMIVSTIPL